MNLSNLFKDFVVLITKMDQIQSYMVKITNANTTDEVVSITNEFFEQNPDIIHLKEQFIADAKYIKSHLMGGNEPKASTETDTKCANCTNDGSCTKDNSAKMDSNVTEVPEKHYDYNTLEAVANELIEKNGKTTNLDIKNELRRQGYYATQTGVSSAMNEFYEKQLFSMKYDKTVNNLTVKVWTKPVIDARPAVPVAVADANTDSDDWAVYIQNNPSVFSVCDGSMTRDQARSWHAKNQGVNRDNVRAIKINNYLKKYVKTK